MLNKITICAIFLMSLALNGAAITAEWRETSFEDFADGTYAHGGANIYTTADGTIKIIRQQLDVNGDGYLDIVFSNKRNDRTFNVDSYIYLGSASGFRHDNKIELPTHGATGNSIVNLNNDGYPDIVFSNWADGQTHNINSYIYWGSASGFSPKVKTRLPTHGAEDNSIADLNGDGYLDIVFSNVSPDKTYNVDSYIYWGSASGFSHEDITELPTHGATDNSIADLNGDGYLDIVFSNWCDDHTYNIDSYIYWGSASGFSDKDKTELPVHAARGNSIADLNGDGYMDIVFSKQHDGITRNINSYIYWGSASGFSHEDKTELPTHSAFGNSIADLNGDGYLDIVFSNQRNDSTHNINSYIYWGSASGFSREDKTELPTHGARGNSIADLNGDGYLDIIFANFDNGSTHNINSYIYWGSAPGFSPDDVPTELPTHGAHFSTTADLGNVYNRNRELVYTSNTYDTGNFTTFASISWIANAPYNTALKFQIRTARAKAELATAEWYGPTSTFDRYTTSGTVINPVHNDDRWVQYRAYFLLSDPIGVATPSLKKVSIEYLGDGLTIPITTDKKIYNPWESVQVLADVDNPDLSFSANLLGGIIVMRHPPQNPLILTGEVVTKIINPGLNLLYVSLPGITGIVAPEGAHGAFGVLYTDDSILAIDTSAWGLKRPPSVAQEQFFSDFIRSYIKRYGIENLMNANADNLLAAPASDVPSQTALSNAFPAPANPETWFPFRLSEPGEVKIQIHNASGQLVKTLNLGYKDAGYYLSKEKAAFWDGRNDRGERVASGIYFYTMQTRNFTATGKVVILK